MSVHVIVPVYNGWTQTKKCLTALLPEINEQYRVVIVDHGSTDRTKVGLAKHFPEVVHLLESDRLWWAGATNVGIRHALADGATHVVLMNNDCVIAPDVVRRLVALASTHDSIVAPVQRDASNNKVIAARAWPAIGFGFPTLRVQTNVDAGSSELSETKLIMGARGVAIPSRVFDDVGLFAEEELPHYLADHDFYLRCRRAGVRLYVSPNLDVLVDGARTSVAAKFRNMTWQEYRNSLVSPRSHRNLPAATSFFRRNYPIRSLWHVGLWLHEVRWILVWGTARVRRLVFGEPDRVG